MTILPLQKSPGDKIAGVYILHFSPHTVGGGGNISLGGKNIISIMRY